MHLILIVVNTLEQPGLAQLQVVVQAHDVGAQL